MKFRVYLILFCLIMGPKVRSQTDSVQFKKIIGLQGTYSALAYQIEETGTGVWRSESPGALLSFSSIKTKYTLYAGLQYTNASAQNRMLDLLKLPDNDYAKTAFTEQIEFTLRYKPHKSLYRKLQHHFGLVGGTFYAQIPFILRGNLWAGYQNYWVMGVYGLSLPIALGKKSKIVFQTELGVLGYGGQEKETFSNTSTGGKILWLPNRIATEVSFVHALGKRWNVSLGLQGLLMQQNAITKIQRYFTNYTIGLQFKL
jgi:hypothetical protein